MHLCSMLIQMMPPFSVTGHGPVSSLTTTPTSSTTTTTTGWWMTAEMEKGIEGIDPRPAISSLFLPSVKQVPRGDGFCLPKEWINGGRREGVWLRPGPSWVVLSSGQNGGGRGVIDKAPGGEEVPMPQVEWGRGLREEKLSSPSLAWQQAHAHHEAWARAYVHNTTHRQVGIMMDG